MKSFLQSLDADEASGVLKALLDDDSELVEKAYNIAMEVVGDADSDEIMEAVYFELDLLDAEDIGSLSGRTRHGYVEPTEAAWMIFEDALRPFIDAMEKNQRRGLPAASKIHCIGIIKGLRIYEEESQSEFKDWLPDAPGEYIATVVKEWKKGKPSREDIAEVMGFVKGG